MNDDELLIDYASKSTRFANNIIDSIFFWMLFITHVFLFEGWQDRVFGHESGLFNLFVLFIFYFMYHMIFESLFGRTPAKFLTGTKVVDENQNKPGLQTLAIRNLCRLIPFDPLSFLIFDFGWHDSISKTRVVNK